MIRTKIKKLLYLSKLNNLYLTLRDLYWKNVFKKKLNKLRKTGRVDPPYNIIFETNYACNLHCTFCFQSDERLKHSEKTLKIEEIKRMFNKITPKKINKVTVMGGETFLRQDIFQMFEFFEESAINFEIITNGTLLDDKKIESLNSFKYLRGLTFSIHGHGEAHDKIVGVRGAFRKAMVSLSKFSNKSVHLAISTVVTRNNYYDLIKLIDEAVQLKLNEIMLSLEFSRRIIKNSNPQKNKYEDDSSIRANIIDKINEAHQYALRKNIALSFPTNLMSKKYIDSFYNQKIIENIDKTKLFCRDLFDLRIDPQGNLFFCLLVKKIFGNLTNTNIDDIINSEEITKVRRDIASGKFMKICERCCKLDIMS